LQYVCEVPGCKFKGGHAKFQQHWAVTHEHPAKKQRVSHSSEEQEAAATSSACVEASKQELNQTSLLESKPIKELLTCKLALSENIVDPVYCEDNMTYCRWSIIQAALARPDGCFRTPARTMDRIVGDNLERRNFIFEIDPTAKERYEERRREFLEKVYDFAIDGNYAELARHYKWLKTYHKNETLDQLVTCFETSQTLMKHMRKLEDRNFEKLADYFSKEIVRLRNNRRR
jgi:hypothetical protein